MKGISNECNRASTVSNYDECNRASTVSNYDLNKKETEHQEEHGAQTELIRALATSGLCRLYTRVIYKMKKSKPHANFTSIHSLEKPLLEKLNLVFNHGKFPIF